MKPILIGERNIHFEPKRTSEPLNFEAYGRRFYSSILRRTFYVNSEFDILQSNDDCDENGEKIFINHINNQPKSHKHLCRYNYPFFDIVTTNSGVLRALLNGIFLRQTSSIPIHAAIFTFEDKICSLIGKSGSGKTQLLNRFLKESDRFKFVADDFSFYSNNRFYSLPFKSENHNNEIMYAGIDIFVNLLSGKREADYCDSKCTADSILNATFAKNISPELIDSSFNFWECYTKHKLNICFSERNICCIDDLLRLL